jgi:hypothetical protein
VRTQCKRLRRGLPLLAIPGLGQRQRLFAMQDRRCLHDFRLANGNGAHILGAGFCECDAFAIAKGVSSWHFQREHGMNQNRKLVKPLWGAECGSLEHPVRAWVDPSRFARFEAAQGIARV